MDTSVNLNGTNNEKNNQMIDDNNMLNNVGTSKDFNTLVDKVYLKILDLAKDKSIFQLNINQNNNNNQFGTSSTSESEISMEEENQRAYAPQNILTSNSILYGILKHTCLNCSKSYEQAKCLRRHFILEHIVYKPTYQCLYCIGDDNCIYDLDKYLQHLLTKHNTLNDLETVYDLLILKYTQDVFCDYFTEGRFYLDPQQLKHINKLKFGKENCTLIQKMHSKIYENYFICDDDANLCKPPITLTSKSIKSNLLYSQITKANVFKEIIEYLRIDPNLMNNEALNAYMFVQNCTINTENKLANANSDNCKYNQCKFCMKIFRECNAYKEHVMEVHTFNEFCNRCLVCPYCKQILKSNFDKNVDANVLLNVHIKKCISLKSDFSYVLNTFKNPGGGGGGSSSSCGFYNNSNNGVSVIASALFESANNNNNNNNTIMSASPVVSNASNTNIAATNSSNGVNRTRKRDDHYTNDTNVVELTRKKVKINNNSNSNAQPFKNRKLCYLCNYSTDSNIDKHIFDEHSVVKCTLCMKDILKNEITEHLNEIHIPDATEICYSCPFPVNNDDLDCKNHLDLDEFLNHKCINKKLDLYKANLKCPICNENTFNEQEKSDDYDDNNLNKLKQHFYQLHSKAVYNCELCTASFRNSWCLTEHILADHKNDIISEITTGNILLKCFKCLKVINYKNENDLKLHETSDSCVEIKKTTATLPVVLAVGTEIATKKIDSTVVPQEEILMETVETIIEPATATAELPIVNHQHNGTEEENLITNSNIYINPLSILSNVSTSVPHILSVKSLETNELETQEMKLELADTITITEST